VPQRRIYVLGAQRVCDGVRTVTLSPMAQRLVGYLAMSVQARRGDVATALWPDATDSSSARALRVALSRLRQDIGADWVKSGRQVLELEADIWCDCRVVADAVRALGSPNMIGLDDARKALSFYAGDAFCGCYDSWALGMRQQLHDLALLGYERIVDRAIAAGEWDLVLECSLSGLALEPLHESFHRGVMLAHGHRGNPAASIRQYRRLQDLLTIELGISPSRVTRDAFYAAMRTAAGGD
jgi:DNA-binding SARP family transcriptional activator